MSQQMELFRVTERIGQLVLEFFRAHQVGEEFHAEDLRRFVDKHCVSAPGSADRVMRSLRKQGLINYSVVSRKSSLYRRENVGAKGATNC